MVHFYNLTSHYRILLVCYSKHTVKLQTFFVLLYVFKLTIKYITYMCALYIVPKYKA